MLDYLLKILIDALFWIIVISTFFLWVGLLFTKVVDFLLKDVGVKEGKEEEE